MKRLIHTLLLACTAMLPLAAQPASGPEVGVVEHLGEQARLGTLLKDEQGRTVTLGALVDKPTLLTLNYFRCSGVCTPQLLGVLDVAGKLKAAPGQDYQIITVSFDDRDTPEMALRKRDNFLQEMSRPFPPDAWHFLTGSAQETRALADSVGFRFKREGDSFSHAALLVVLSPKGKITRYIYGVNYTPEDITQAVAEAARGEAKPTVNKWLQFCFVSDKGGNGYVFSAMRLVATLTLVVIVIFVIVLVVSARRKRRKHEGERV
nr:SCO family protein [uncultured Holophaga sp.]